MVSVQFIISCWLFLTYSDAEIWNHLTTVEYCYLVSYQSNVWLGQMHCGSPNQFFWWAILLRPPWRDNIDGGGSIAGHVYRTYHIIKVPCYCQTVAEERHLAGSSVGLTPSLRPSAHPVFCFCCINFPATAADYRGVARVGMGGAKLSRRAVIREATLRKFFGSKSGALKLLGWWKAERRASVVWSQYT